MAWDKLGQAASVMQLTGVDALGLVSMIVQAAQDARGNRDLCLQLAQHVEIVGDLVAELQIPELRRYPETSRPLDQLHAALCHTYKLVRSCSQQQENTSLVRQMFTGHDVAAKLRRAQEVIDRYITLIPVITTIAVIRAREDSVLGELLRAEHCRREGQRGAGPSRAGAHRTRGPRCRARHVDRPALRQAAREGPSRDGRHRR